jgi:flagellar protein FliS
MNKLGSYKQNQVLSASPAELILLLFDEGLRSLKKAEAAFAIETPDRFESISKQLLHTQDVLMELSLSLDLEKGGEVAANLQRIYDFMIRHLSKANSEKLIQPVIEVHHLLTTLRNAWQEVTEKQLAGEPDAAHPATTTGTSQRILAAG